MVKKYEARIRQVLREIPLAHVAVWKEAQARKLDRSRVKDIAKSIRSEGLQNPPVLQKHSKDRYLLISGHHRLAALRSLGAKKAKFLVITKDTAYTLEDAKAASVAENLHRVQMRTSELAAACVFLAGQVGKVQAARMLGMTPPTFRKYHGFAGVPDRLKELVPEELSRDEATALYQIIPGASKALRVVSDMEGLDKRSRKLYLAALAKSPKSGRDAILGRIRKASRAKKKFTVRLAQSSAAKLARMAEEGRADEARLIARIVGEYLRSSGARAAPGRGAGGRRAAPAAKGRKRAAPAAKGRKRAAPAAKGRKRAAPAAKGRKRAAPAAKGRKRAAPAAKGRKRAAPAAKGRKRAAPAAKGRKRAAPAAKGRKRAAPAAKGGRG